MSRPGSADTWNVDDQLTARVRRRVLNHAWSRAGAVAAVVSAGTTRRVLTFSTRLMMLTAGSFIISVSVAITIWNRLGPGPLDVFIGAISARTGLPLSIALWVTVGSMIAVATMLGRRPGLGTVLSPFMIGLMMQTVLAGLQQFEPPGSLIARVLMHLVAIGGIGIGAGALIASGLGAGSGELLAGAASDKVEHGEPKVRLAIEATWIVVGVAFGGPAGLGTVLVGLFVGPAVARGYRTVDAIVARSVRTVANTHAAIIARELQYA
jgi:uncharacterized membrane protein YczE